MNITVLRTAILGLCLTALAAGCGGGGGDGDGGSSGLSTNECGRLGLTAKIINGTECADTGSPVVLIQLYLGNGTLALCSGTMVTPTQVLTAAHCFTSGDVQAASISENGREVFARSVAVHPGVDEDASGNIFNDAAILNLERTVSLRTLPVIASAKVESGDTIAIYGYGLDQDGELGVLRSGSMLVSEVTPNHIFSFFEGDGSNTCQGDSGGPAIITTSVNGAAVTGVVGMTSTGTVVGCGEGDLSLFANAQESSILNFIRQQAPGTDIR